MKLPRGRVRPALILVAIAGVVLFTVVNAASLAEFVARYHWPTDPAAWLGIVTVAALVIGGSLLRTLRTKVLLDTAKRGSTWYQFRALAVGYFFNVVFPLRVGELVRAFLLSRQLRISLLYTVVTVVVERLLDVVLVAAIFLVVALATSVVPITFASASALVLIVAVILLVVFVLLIRENDLLMRIVWRGTRIFSMGGERRLRMSTWSVVHGFQQFLASGRNIVRYLGYFVGSWTLYLGALVVLVSVVVPIAIDEPAVAILAPFLVPEALFSQQTFANYAETLHSFFITAEVSDSSAQAIALSGLVWAVLNVPISVLGLCFVFSRSLTTRGTRKRDGDRQSSVDRTGDRGNDLTAFLDSYFRRDGLAQTLHQLDVRGDIELMRFFKGGSDAVTALIRDGAGIKVRKLVPAIYRDRLRVQFDWLVARADEPLIVNVIGEVEREDYYAIDLDYTPETVSLFSFVHTHSLASSEKVLADTWFALYDTVYELDAVGHHPLVRDEYIEERLVLRVELASTHHVGIAQALEHPTITIGNAEYLNFREVIAAIKDNPRAWNDLAVFQTSSAIHGDLTVDNILVDLRDRSPLVIDPSDDNQIRGPIIDFARHFQSLWGGYEFINDIVLAPSFDVDALTGGAAISFPEIRSARYQELAASTLDFAEQKLSPEELRSLPFHVGLFYGRMLTHRVTIDPQTALIYYAKCVEFLNRFYAQYSDPLIDDVPIGDRTEETIR